MCYPPADATEGATENEGTAVTVLAQSAAIPQPRPSVEVGPMSASSAAALSSVVFIEPMAGFDADIDFSLSPIDEAGMLQSLRSVRDPELRFVLSPAEVFFPDYRDSLTPVIQSPVSDALGIAAGAAELRMYVMLTIGTSLTDTTANLRAPLVVDQVTGRAVQVILDDDSLPLRQLLPTG